MERDQAGDSKKQENKNRQQDKVKRKEENINEKAIELWA